MSRGLLPDLLRGALPCPVCRRDWGGRSGCCAGCRARLFEPTVEGGGSFGLALPGLVSLGYYRGDLARAIRAYKYRSVRRLAPVFGRALATLVVTRGWRPAVVTYVPLHAARLKQRGFDQARLLAGVLAAELGLPCHRLLNRTRSTSQQARLDAGKRRRNVRGVFYSTGWTGGPVLLVDDVFTTGATTSACREALERGGARFVLLAVLAVAPRSTGRADQSETMTPLVIPSRAPTNT